MEAVSELETVKWLLVAILIAVIVIALSAVSVAVSIWLAVRAAKEETSGHAFRADAEEYLARDECDELVRSAEHRLGTHPQDAWTHWYLGRAKFNIGKLPESKRCFEKVIELEPSWTQSAESWIARINEEIDKGPKLVE
jgi:cytochrome c-type biogenesis protein CcmH/NrfG